MRLNGSLPDAFTVAKVPKHEIICHSERIRQRAVQPHMIVVAPLERSRRPSTSFILRFMGLCLSFEKNLDSICSPHGDASTEKIRIFGPQCTCQSECCGEYRPITFVSTAQPLLSKTA